MTTGKLTPKEQTVQEIEFLKRELSIIIVVKCA